MRLSRMLSVAALSASLLALTLGLTSVRRDAALELTSLFVLFGYGLSLLVAVAYGLGRWQSLGWRSLAPGLILLAAIPGARGVMFLDRELRDVAFGRYFPRLEGRLDELRLFPGDVTRLRREDLPLDTRACCYGAVVRRDSDDRLSAVFFVQPRLAYLYDPSGVALPRALRRRWEHHDPVAPNWYRLER
jgi:hypothetical protein